MGKILYYVLKLTFIFIAPLYNAILALRYGWKRKTQKGYKPIIENPLLLKSATTLAKGIREGKLKSVEIVQAYIDRILKVDPYINATAERCFEKALEEAKSADNLVASGKYTNPQLAEYQPLLGVPFTAKHILKVKGVRCNSGSPLFEDEIAKEDATCIALLRKAGAIIIATTNLPDLALHVESINFVYGTTSNPYDLRRTSGGSSGGEGALIGAAGSVIGIGNDLIGSIRLPSHFNGIFGHKPTRSAVPNSGCFPVDTTFLDEFLSTGPMCRYAEDLEVMMKILTAEYKIPLQFGKPVKFENLKILYIEQITPLVVYDVDKEIKCGLKSAVTYFQTNYGTKAENIENLNPLRSLICQTNECAVYAFVKQIKLLKDFKSAVTGGKGDNINLMLDVIKFFFGASTFSEGPLLLMSFLKYPLLQNTELGEYYRKIREKMEDEFNRLLDDNTVLILPTFPTTAPYHHGMIPRIPSTYYCSLFNILGLPSTQCPIGFTSQGMPYGIQIAAKQNNDNLTIACAAELEKAFGGWRPPGEI